MGYFNLRVQDFPVSIALYDNLQGIVYMQMLRKLES